MLNPKIKQPVGHIALSFKPEDKPRLSNEFMAKIAMEYMDLMGIKDTQFILVRHNNTDNPHCHLVYNRIGYDGKVISSQGDYKRNEIATKRLKDKYGLTYAEDKGKTNVTKLHDSERIKYEIYHAVKQALKRARTWKELVVGLALQGIKLEFVGRGGKMKSAGDIQGIRLTKDGLTFKGSQISREFSFAKLNAILGGNSPDTGVDLEVKKQNQAPSNRNRKEQEPSNMALKATDWGCFLLLASLFRKNRSRMTNCCASARRKRNGKGLDYKSAPNNQSLKCKTLKSMNL